ncbi:unnamed protein product [Arabidopsis thaliana]|uniref:AAA+ ATPase domain-containing protein n=1 Tax=Arabidopsis thaliana TaxID=3702 RepID=A0A654EFP8_ARATH|nr:unnamed protein product [Arabidopsis thaliana]
MGSHRRYWDPVEVACRKIMVSFKTDNVSKIVLIGEAGIGKTWLARKTSEYATKDGSCHIAIWLNLNKEYDEMSLYKSIASQLSVFPKNKEGDRDDSDEDDSEDEEEQKYRDFMMLKYQIHEELRRKRKEKKYPLLILDDAESVTSEKKVMKDLYLLDFLAPYRPLKILITRRKGEDDSLVVSDGEIKSDGIYELPASLDYHAIDVSQILRDTFTDDYLMILLELLIKDELRKSLQLACGGDDGVFKRRIVEMSMGLPAAVVVLAKSLNCISQKQEKVFKTTFHLLSSFPPDTADCGRATTGTSRRNPILCLAYELLKTYDTVNGSIVDCFWHSLSFFEHCGCVNYQELITHWIIEGYLDPIRSITKAYKDGHAILVELINRGILKIQEDNVVMPEVAMNSLIDLRRHGKSGTSLIGLAKLCGSDMTKGLGKINQVDDIIEAVRATRKGEKIITVLVSGNRLRRETPERFFEKLKDLEILGFFKSTLDHFVPYLVKLVKLRVLVIRDCGLLKDIEELKALKGLHALEVSGASSLKEISDEFFIVMPDLQSLHLSGLQIKSSPSSISQLKKLIRLIIRDCAALEDLPDIQKLEMLESVDVSGARGLRTSFDNTKDEKKNRNFYHLTKLQHLDLSGSQIERLPMFQDSGVATKLRSLTHILLRNCSKLRKLPNLKPLSGLRILDLSGSTSLLKIREVCFEDKKELKTLNLSRTNLSQLATTIEELSNLSELLLRDCTNLEVLPNIQKLTNLEVIDVSGCKKLHTIEGSFEDMRYLREVNLSGTKVETPELPKESKIRCLKRINLADEKQFEGTDWSEVRKAMSTEISEDRSSSDAVFISREISEKDFKEIGEIQLTSGGRMSYPEIAKLEEKEKDQKYSNWPEIDQEMRKETRRYAQQNQEIKDENLCNEIMAFLGINGPQRVLLTGRAGIGKTRLAKKVAEHATKMGFCFLTVCLHLNRKFEDEWSLYENIASQLSVYSDFEETEVYDRDEDEKEEKTTEALLDDLKKKIIDEIMKLVYKLPEKKSELVYKKAKKLSEKKPKKLIEFYNEAEKIVKNLLGYPENQPAEKKAKKFEKNAKKAAEKNVKKQLVNQENQAADRKLKPTVTEKTPTEGQKKDTPYTGNPYLLLILDDEGNKTSEDVVMKDLKLEEFLVDKILKDGKRLKVLVTRRKRDQEPTKHGKEIESPDTLKSKKKNEEHEEANSVSEIVPDVGTDVENKNKEAEIDGRGPSTSGASLTATKCYDTTDFHTTDVSEVLLNSIDETNLRYLFASLTEDWITYKSLLSNMVKNSKNLPAAVVVLAKSLNWIMQSTSDPEKKKDLKVKIDRKIEEVLSSLQSYPSDPGSSSESIINPILHLAYELLETYSHAILDCFWHSLDFFEHCGCVYYRDLITQWILEGYFDPVRSVEKAYQLGHSILMELINRGMLKIQENNVVVPEMAMRNVIDPRRRGHLGRSRLGFSRVYGGDKAKGIGKITQLDDIIKTVQAKKGDKITTILVSGDRLRGVTPKKYFAELGDLEVLGFFEPTLDPFVPAFLNLLKLRVLVIRDCDLLEDIEKLKALIKLNTLEVSGASCLKKISDEFFKAFPKLQSLHLSALQITSSPSSISELNELHCLIIKDCPLLEDLPDIQELVKLEVVDISGALGLQTCFNNRKDSKKKKRKKKSKNKNFYHLTQLQLLDFSESQIDRLPIFQDSPVAAKLYSLTRLLLRDCSKLRRLPSLKPLSVLEVIDVSGCTNLQIVEGSFEDLSYLREVNLFGTKVLTPKLPKETTIHCLKCFTRADGSCFKGNTWSKIKVDIERDRSGEREIKSNEPSASDCTEKRDVSKERLLKVPIDRALYRNTLISLVDSKIPQEVLEINETNKVDEEALANAEFVSFVDCTPTRLTSIFEKAKSVKGCWLRMSFDIKDLFFGVDEERLVLLETLSITNLPSLETITSVGNLENLKYLSLDCCPKVKTIFSEMPRRLQVLNVKHCEKLEKVVEGVEVSNHNYLSLEVENCPNFNNILPSPETKSSDWEIGEASSQDRRS